MRILDVIPIAKNIGVETLSYFSAKDVPVGSLVTIPVRKKGVTAVVLASHDIKTLKTDIKQADFQLRNIISTHKETLFLPEFIKTCVLLKNYYGTRTGPVLASLVPKIFLEEYLESAPVKKLETTNKDILMPEKFILQASYEERIAYYKTYIRQGFADKQSIFILCPTVADIEGVADEIQKGITDHVIILHASLTKKNLRERYEEVLSHKHPVVIVATMSFLFVPRADIGTIIVEREGSSQYRQIARPYIDGRDLAFILAHTRGMKYLAADQLLRIETLWKVKEEHYGEARPLSFHLENVKNIKILPMKSNDKQKDAKKVEKEDKKEFKVFSEDLKKIIKDSIKNNEHLLLFVGRKGLAPITVCEHCGEVLRSPESGLPLVLYHKKDKNGKKKSVYQCPKTQKMFETINTCQNCESWKLKLMGIGTETIEKELLSLFPKATVTIIDGQHTKTHNATKKAMASFLKKKSGVLIATEKALPYLRTKLNNIAIVSIDNLFSVPGYSVQEKTMRLLLRLRELSQETLLIQTRNPEQQVLQEIKKGNIIDFYRSELQDRKKFLYPPYVLLLDIHVSATQVTLSKKRKYLQNIFEPFNVQTVVLPGSKRGIMTVHAIIKIPKGEWIEKTSSKNPGRTFRDMFHILENLPQSYKVQVNPDKI